MTISTDVPTAEPLRPGTPGTTGALVTTCRVPGAATAGAYAVVEHTLAPGALAAPPHRHSREDEVSVVLDGVLTVWAGGRAFSAGPGEVVRKPRGEFHTFWNEGPAPVRLLEIISPAGFEHYFDELAAFVPADAPPDVGAIMALAGRYGLEVDMASVGPLLARHGLQFGR